MKSAVTQFPVIEEIKKRWSPRAFDTTKSVTKDDMNTILEAASWAPSAMNEKPWRYVVALKEDSQKFNAIVSCLFDANTLWAKNASALVVSFAKLTYSSNGKTNSAALHDTGMANQNMLLQAASMDIHTHVMGGFDKEKTKVVFQTDSDLQPVVIIAFGILGNAEDLPEALKTRELAERTRKHITEIVLPE
jgi:nitroreductase